MSEGPILTRQKHHERAAREVRLARALRENLRRRKEQARAQDRSEGPSAEGEPEREPSA